jgi:hypothetical protein
LCVGECADVPCFVVDPHGERFDVQIAGVPFEGIFALFGDALCVCVCVCVCE